MAIQHELIANRYTRALWDFSKDKNAAEILKELEAFTASYELSSDLKKFISNPTFSEVEKENVLMGLCQSLGTTETVTKFLKLVLSKGRMEAIPEITHQFKKEVYNSENKAELFIETAFPLSADEESKIVQALERSTGKKLSPIVKENKKLVAGIKVNVLGQSIDSSLMSSLGNLKQELLQGEV